MGSDRATVLTVYKEWETVNEKVAALSLDALTVPELLELQHRREVVARSMPAVDHQIINRLAAEADPKALGGTSLADVVAWFHAQGWLPKDGLANHRGTRHSGFVPGAGQRAAKPGPGG